MQSKLISDPSSAEMVAALVSGQGEVAASHATATTTLRLPVHLLAHVDALAARAGKTRTAMMALVLDAGLEEIVGHLDADTIEALSVDAGSRIDALLAPSSSREDA